MSRANSYVYEITNNETPLQISNVYIPNIYEAVFGDKMNTALLRFLRSDQRTIATYSVPIPSENPDGSRTQKEGAYLPDGILQAVLSPDASQLAYLTQNNTGATITFIPLGSSKKSTFI